MDHSGQVRKKCNRGVGKRERYDVSSGLGTHAQDLQDAHALEQKIAQNRPPKRSPLVERRVHYLPNMSKPSQRFVTIAAVDASVSATSLVEIAARMASGIVGAELHIAHVIKPPHLPSDTRSVVSQGEATGEKELEYLKRLTSLASGIFQGRVVGHLAEGEPWREIVQLAEDLRADLVFVAPHDATGLKRLVLGSVSEQVVRKAKCPVLVVRPKDYENPTVPEIEAACDACLAKQHETSGQQLWCDEHAKKHPRARTYYETPSSFAMGSSLLRP